MELKPYPQLQILVKRIIPLSKPFDSTEGLPQLSKDMIARGEQQIILSQPVPRRNFLCNVTMEQAADLRLTIGALSIQECRDALMSLSDLEIQDAVFDRAICFPDSEWTQRLRGKYVNGAADKQDTVLDFSLWANNAIGYLNQWENKKKEGLTMADYIEFGNRIILNTVNPHIDSIGLFASINKSMLTKKNGLNNIGQIATCLTRLPIVDTLRGRDILQYDAVTRAAMNIMASVTEVNQKQWLLDGGIREAYLELSKAGRLIGIFDGLDVAVSLGHPAPIPYCVPYIQNPRANTPATQQNQQGQMEKTTQGATSKPQPCRSTAGTQENAPSAAPNNEMTYAAYIQRGIPTNQHANQTGVGDSHGNPQIVGTSIMSTREWHAKAEALKKSMDSATPTPSDNADGASSNKTELHGSDALPCNASGSTAVLKQREEVNKIPQDPLDDVWFIDFTQILETVEMELYTIHKDEPVDVQKTHAPQMARRIEATIAFLLNQTVERLPTLPSPAHRFALIKHCIFSMLWAFEVLVLGQPTFPLSAEVSRILRRNVVLTSLWDCCNLVPDVDKPRMVSSIYLIILSFFCWGGGG